MKKFMLIAMIGLGFMLVGCNTSFEDSPDKDKTWILHGNDVVTKVVTIEGHRYVIMDGFKCGGIIHAESCGCKK